MYRIDYDGHPAFMPLKVEPASLPSELATAIDRLDGDMLFVDQAVEAGDAASARQARYVHRAVTAATETLPRQLHAALLEARADWSDWEKGQLRRYAVYLDLEYARYVRHQARRLRRAAVGLPSDKSGAAMHALQASGVIPFRVSETATRRIAEAAAPHVAQMRRGSSAKPNSFHAKTIHRGHLRFWRAIASAAEEVGAGALASRYLGYSVGLSSVGLHIHEAGNSYFNKRYDDVGVATSRAAGMHFDTGSGSLKAMLYLSNVSAEDGAFSYVVGTHRLQIPHSLRFSGQALSAIGNMLDTPEARRLFMKLPRALRQNAHLGGDYYESTQEAAVLAQERRFTSHDGELILFDNAGLHRGGVQPRNERIALQLQFSSLVEKALTRVYRWRRGL